MKCPLQLSLTPEMNVYGIKFQPLLEPLQSSPRGRHLSRLSVQTKIEKFLLAEMVFEAECLYPDFEFWMEEKRRDLTIRLINPQSVERGKLVEWIEAKMCYSYCLARNLTGQSRPDEYRDLLVKDAEKQRCAELHDPDREAVLTTALFVIHPTDLHPRHLYYSKFSNRRGPDPSEIKSAAVSYCVERIPIELTRSINERFELQLEPSTELLCYFYREPTKLPGWASND